MLTDLIQFTVKEDRLADAIQYLKEQLENTRGDKGCVSAQLFQSIPDPRVFYLLLRWENEETLQAHLKQPYDLAFREKMDPILAAPVEPVQWRALF
jgi:quinol monooxygenase YgiN